MAYTTIDDPSAYFQTKLYTGNSSTQSITFDGNTNMQPDWVWIKSRSATEWHQVHDSVRGVAKYLFTNTDSAEGERSPNDQVTSFDSNGFSLGAGANDSVNTNSGSYASWNWKAGTSFTNDASSTGIGTIDSTGSASDTSGFSIVSYTGTGSTGTMKHGLSTAPSMIIIKNRSVTKPWQVGHKSLGFQNGIYLNETSASQSDNGAFNSTNPTTSVFTIETSSYVNTSGHNYIAYCFAEKQGYSKFGSYTGNGSDTQFIYTGFAPAFVLWKNTNESDNHWCIIHNKAETFNGTYGRTSLLRPNDSGAEIDGVSNTRGIDFLSNGFCLRSWGGSTGTITANESGDKYIFMCFAENPFVTSTGVPATAR